MEGKFTKYPELDTMTLEEKLNFKLKQERAFENSKHTLLDIQRFFDEQYKHYSKKDKRTTRLSVFFVVVGVISSSSGFGGGIASATGLGVVVGAPLGITFGSIGLVSLVASYCFNKKKQRYNFILAEIKKNRIDFELLLKEANRDGVIDEREFKKLTQKYKFYLKRKEDIKKNTDFKKEDMFDDDKINIDEVVKKAIFDNLKSKNEL